MSTVLEMPVAQAEPRSCTSCRRQRYDSGTDAFRCTESRSPAMGGVIWIGVQPSKQEAHSQREMEAHCRVTAERCKFFQLEG